LVCPGGVVVGLPCPGVLWGGIADGGVCVAVGDSVDPGLGGFVVVGVVVEDVRPVLGVTVDPVTSFVAGVLGAVVGSPVSVGEGVSSEVPVVSPGCGVSPGWPGGDVTTGRGPASGRTASGSGISGVSTVGPPSRLLASTAT
jgi:hypothetical protein